MIKRIIFDLDNTIIMWKSEYVSALIKTMDEFNVKIDYKLIDDVIEEQEKITDRLTKQSLLDDINKKCNLNLNIDFINKLLENQKELAPEKDEKLIELFSYLSSKYEIVMLSNYFKETQIGRLEKLDIAKYFKEFYGCEEIVLKPNEIAFKKAIGPYKYEECIMIGDNYECDIKTPLKINMPVIQVDLKDKIKEEKEYKVIKKFDELKDIL